MKCEQCGKEHEVLEPSFRRPDVVFSLSAAERKALVEESDDLCVMRSPTPGVSARHFVRCILPVLIVGEPPRFLERLRSPRRTAWGFWAEVPEPDFKVVVATWTLADPTHVPRIRAQLANDAIGYPPTIGLPVVLKLTGRKSRPQLSFVGPTDHPFALECLAGVGLARAASWVPHRP